MSSLFTFGISFVIQITAWLSYTRTTSVLPMEGPIMARLNVVLLFSVAVEPYLLTLFSFSTSTLPLADFDSSLFALDIGAVNGIMGFFTHELTNEEKNSCHRIS